MLTATTFLHNIFWATLSYVAPRIHKAACGELLRHSKRRPTLIVLAVFALRLDTPALQYSVGLLVNQAKEILN